MVSRVKEVKSRLTRRVRALADKPPWWLVTLVPFHEQVEQHNAAISFLQALLYPVNFNCSILAFGQ